MIQDMGNVELFELFETDVIQYTLDLLSIPNYVIKKDNLMAIDVGKLQKRKNIIKPII